MYDLCVETLPKQIYLNNVFLETYMIAKLILATTLAVSIPAFAAPEWVKLAYSSDSTSYLDVASFSNRGDFVHLQLLRNYEQLITLGNDPTTNAVLHPHRSVKLGYLANCESGKVSLSSWQMFSGNFGRGETVWADREQGAPAFIAPSTDQESSALSAACSSRVSAAGSIAFKG